MKKNDFKQVAILYISIIGGIVAMCIIGKLLGIPEFVEMGVWGC